MSDVSSRLARAWQTTFRNQQVTVKLVILTAFDGQHEDLAEALSLVAESAYPGFPCSPQKVGKWLSRARERTFEIDDAFYRFFGSKGGIWQLKPVVRPQPDDFLLPDEVLDAAVA